MRHLKQFFYGIFYLALLSAIGSGAYYALWKPAPSCFDNIRNQSEEGVDCGGQCSRMCLPELAPLSAAEVKILTLPSASSSIIRGTFVAELRNSNQEWAAKDFLYTFYAYDGAGGVIASSTGSSFVYAGGIKYLVEANIGLAGIPARAEVKIEEPRWRKTTEFSRPATRVVLESTDADQVISAHGTLANEGALPINSELIALFYDNFGSLAGASLGSVERVLPGEAREFAIFHPLVDNLAPEATRILDYSYQVR